VLGYQGVSVLFICQRQSGYSGSRSQTGLPRAPARWAVELSTVRIKSQAEICAENWSRSFRACIVLS